MYCVAKSNTLPLIQPAQEQRTKMTESEAAIVVDRICRGAMQKADALDARLEQAESALLEEYRPVLEDLADAIRLAIAEDRHADARGLRALVEEARCQIEEHAQWLLKCWREDVEQVRRDTHEGTEAVKAIVRPRAPSRRALRLAKPVQIRRLPRTRARQRRVHRATRRVAASSGSDGSSSDGPPSDPPQHLASPSHNAVSDAEVLS